MYNTLLNLVRHFNGRMIIGLLFLQDSYLVKTGWFKSVGKMQAIDVSQQEIPWFAYPFIAFLQPRLHKKLTVFEYGCGNSTHWFARHVEHITSLEHTKKWHDQLKNKLPQNVELVFEEVVSTKSYHELAFQPLLTETPYSRKINTRPDFYNIVIVDGIYRNNCIVNAIEKLTPDGIIILDNLEYGEELKSGIDFLVEKNFRKIEFWGLSPIVYTQTCTSIFYRPDNCLNI
jgi:hypothetical protein